MVMLGALHQERCRSVPAGGLYNGTRAASWGVHKEREVLAQQLLGDATCVQWRGLRPVSPGCVLLRAACCGVVLRCGAAARQPWA